VSEQLIKVIPLANNLHLEIWDSSRIISGDRWLVQIEARMDVPLEPSSLEVAAEGKSLMDKLEKTYGSHIPFRYIQKKHFVDEREKDKVSNKFMEGIEKNMMPYLSHPDFSKRLTLSRCREFRRK
jgi:hypothetical protein